MKSKILTILFLGIALVSCDNWFDVTSSNEIREKDHYKTEVGFMQTLTGCYISMAKENLFGKNLSWYLPCIIGNETRSFPGLGANVVETQFQRHDYASPHTKPVIESVWAAGYNVIVNANEALLQIDNHEQQMNAINYHVIKGELLAIRAFMHFQLLRLYGYGDWTTRKSKLDEKKTIPYVLSVSKNMTEQSTGAEVISFLIKDLTAALELLKDYDPVCQAHESAYYDEVNEEGFYNSRNSHLNYYAVKALLTQVYMWEGSDESKNKALKLAEDIINYVGAGVSVTLDGSSAFTLNFLDANSLTKSTSSMVGEALFALSVQNMDLLTSSYINPDYVDTDVRAMYLTSSQAVELYNDADTEEDETSTDIRFTTLLTPNTLSSEAGYTPIKFYQPSLGAYFKNKMPIIRLPEIYYIAAECYATSSAQDLSKAMKMLNMVRGKRALYSPLENLSREQILKAIRKEYRKEYLMEGEAFYFDKRTGQKSIPNFSDMTDKDYVLPFPDMEISSGRIQ